MLEGMLIVAMPKDSEDITSIEGIRSDKNSIVDQTEELENKDTTYIDNDLDVIENAELDESIEAQRDIEEETFNNINLSLG